MTTKKNSTPDFDAFWKAYPLHRGKKEAERAWNRLTAAQKRMAIAALPAYTADCQKHGIAYKYAQGWLNGQRWEDNLTEEVVVTKKADTPADIHPQEPTLPILDKAGTRINDGLTEDEHKAFGLLKQDLWKAWSRNRDDRNGAALKELLKGLELYGINDAGKVVYLRGSRVTFNAEFVVPWFWDPQDFAAIIARHYHDYGWTVKNL